MNDAPRAESRFHAYFRKRIGSLVWALLGFSLIGYLGAWYHLFEFFCHFRLQYLWCAILGGIAMLCFRDFRTGLVALLSFGINAAEVLPWYFGKPPAPASNSPALKLLLSNVYTDNQNTAAVLDLIARENPDIIVLQEIDNRWETALKPIRKTYPNFQTLPQDDNFGIGVWSRLPARIKYVEPGETGVPSFTVNVSVGEKDISIMATHPVPPVRAETFDLRNQQLDALAKWARTVSGPCIILGDLNLTPWSSYHARLIRDSGLRNARQGFGVLPSWPTAIPFSKIPLDHCLVSPGIGVRSIHTGPHVGSDHLPLIVDLVP